MNRILGLKQAPSTVSDGVRRCQTVSDGVSFFLAEGGVPVSDGVRRYQKVSDGVRRSQLKIKNLTNNPETFLICGESRKLQQMTQNIQVFTKYQIHEYNLNDANFKI